MAARFDTVGLGRDCYIFFSETAVQQELTTPGADHWRYTAISKKVVIINSRYWNRKELWASNSRNDLLLLALTLHNIECRLIM